jgi:hypothetical protein
MIDNNDKKDEQAEINYRGTALIMLLQLQADLLRWDPNSLELHLILYNSDLTDRLFPATAMHYQDLVLRTWNHVSAGTNPLEDEELVASATALMQNHNYNQAVDETIDARREALKSGMSSGEPTLAAVQFLLEVRTEFKGMAATSKEVKLALEQNPLLPFMPPDIGERYTNILSSVFKLYTEDKPPVNAALLENVKTLYCDGRFWEAFNKATKHYAEMALNQHDWEEEDDLFQSPPPKPRLN